MRAPVLALFFARNPDSLLDAARISAMVTHAHPLGVEGAVLIALAAHALLERQPAAQVLKIVQSACLTPDISERLKIVASWTAADGTPSPRDAATRLGNGMTAPSSCPTALYIALRYLERPFETMMRFVVECGGDVDTIGAMAGALWDIANGSERLPSVNLEARDDLVDVASRMFRRHASPTTTEQGAAPDGAARRR